MTLTYENILRDFIANTTSLEYKKPYLVVEQFPEETKNATYAWLIVDSVVLYMIPGISREDVCKKLLSYLVDDSFKFGKKETLKNITDDNN